jgi:hypothetical protein
MESFWGTLKNELVHHARYATRAEAISDLAEYIEVSTTGNGFKRAWDISQRWNL